ncbi:MAG: hypothetical protein ACYDHH_23900 [Solirubrobacteraceae bacterium]
MAGLAVIGVACLTAPAAFAKRRSTPPLVLHQRFARLSVAGRMVGSVSYTFIGTQFGPSGPNPGELITNRTGAKRSVAIGNPDYCGATALGGPWLLFSCTTFASPYDIAGELTAELYSPTTGSVTAVPASRGLGQCDINSNSCPFRAVAVGTRWLEIEAPGGHAPNEYWFQNLATGQIARDPTTPAVYANLNSVNLAQKLCKPLQIAPQPLGGEDGASGYAAVRGEIAFYGRFAVIASGATGARLKRCGTSLDVPLGSRALPVDPTSSQFGFPQAGPNISGDVGVIVWQSTVTELSGVFLPSLRQFNLPLPVRVAPAHPATPAEFTLSVSPTRLYLSTSTGTWSTPAPALKN